MGLLETSLIDLSLQEDLYFKDCIYGPPGAGKTTLASSYPKPVWLDFERSTDTLRSLIRLGKLTEGSAFKPKNMKETWDICKAIIASKKWETIVIDTVTRQQKRQMQEYIDGHPTVTKGTRDRFTVYQADYGYSYRILDDFYMWLVEQPINIVILAHDTEKQNATTDMNGNVTYQLVKIQPTLTPKLLESMTELFSLIGYMTANPKGFGDKMVLERKLRINPTNVIVAKNRLNIQEAEIIDPTFKGLHK